MELTSRSRRMISFMENSGKFRLRDGVVERICFVCKQWKPYTAAHFTRRAKRATGLDSRCKACARIATADWYRRTRAQK